MVYLRHTYISDSSHDYVGPFPSLIEGMDHRDDYGPVDADLVVCQEAPDRSMTPEEHITYLEGRM